MKDFNESIKKVVAAINTAPPEQYTFVCEDTPKHDGKLDRTEEWFHASVEPTENVRDDLGSPKVSGIHLHGGYGDCESNCIYLDATQSLSLLAWLEQERQNLTLLAKEQSRDGQRP